jgi:hypothetical protein
MLNRV